MKTSDFDYNLDISKIANFPASPRDSSKLIIVDKKTNNFEEKIFKDIINDLGESDVLVFNETKVIKARLKGHIILQDGRKKEVEIFLLKQISSNTWECQVFPGERLKIGKEVFFEIDKIENQNIKKYNEDSFFQRNDNKNIILSGIIKEVTYAGRVIEFSIGGAEFFEIIDKIGEIPLPPYIDKKDRTLEEYNTVFANIEGSAAAPTAGLHFTDELIEKLEKKGVKIEKVLLHIGLGTFKPITVENILEHEIHTEYIEISQETAKKLNDYKKQCKRIIAVGTTTTRTLESFTDENGKLEFGEKNTNIFIYPGYRFRFIDSIITNFHLPKSSLLVMISAFYNREKLLEIYEYAQEKDYRFFSFGDAMWIK